MAKLYDVKTVFTLDEGLGDRLKVSITHMTTTGKPESVSFYDPDREHMVTVPADLWERVVAAVGRGWEY